MKLPFDFGIKLFFRLLVPGFFLTLGFLPVLYTLLDQVGWSTKYEVAFVISIILAGWVILILDMPIYMLFEGRRFWPAFLWNFFFTREKKRLRRVEWRMNHFQHLDRRKYLEASVEIRKFPMSEEGKFEAVYPTRLGNLITAFELYPLTRHGTDAVFYWPRIWAKLEKDLREEVDNQQAMADSTVYTSFALLAAGVLWGIYSTLATLNISPIGHLPKSITFSWALALTFLLLGYAAYRASLHINAQFGELFKSVFDSQVAKIENEIIDVSGVVKRVSELTKDPSMLGLPLNDRLRIVWRYLNNYRVRCPHCKKVMPPPEVEGHIHEVHPVKEKQLLSDASSTKAIRQ